MNIKEKVLVFMRHKAYKPLSPEDLAASLALQDKELTAFWPALAELEENGEIFPTRTGKYGVPEHMNMAVGQLAASDKGYGFVIPDDPNEEDIFISPDSLASAMHGDRVLVRIDPSRRPVTGRAREGEVVRVVRRANRQVVGTFEASRHYGFVSPDDSRLRQDIFVGREDFGGARSGDKVVVELTKWPEKKRAAEGRIVEVLGHAGDPGLEILAIIKSHNLATAFPPAVEAAATRVPATVGPADLTGRRDLREEVIVTIDGEDAKDLDDAVQVARLPGGRYRLGVHIADVSHYVKAGGALDVEAAERGTSVYLVDRVLPMLPPRLSNGICSLNAGVDRLTLSIQLDIDQQGEVVDYIIFPAVIRVHTRLSYTIVRRILADQDEELREQYRPLLGQLADMELLCHILRQRRLRRGAIDFDFPELKIKLDEAGRPLAVEKRQRSIAESIIEEFMLIANETVAEHMDKLKVPFVFRVHEEPEPEKIAKLNALLHNFGQALAKPGDIRPKALQKVLGRVAGRPEERLISTVMLRSLKQARYEAANLGHFGLAATYYTHFTSPIRRYPDLIVHRQLWETFKGPMSAQRRAKLAASLPEIALHSSQRERAAAEAERATLDLKKVEYMAQFVGEEFAATVSGVTSFGLFVELENGIEGLVHVSTIDDDYYQYNEERYSLIGQRTGKVYRLGDPIKVRLAKVSTAERNIDFVLPETDEANEGRRRGGKGRGGQAAGKGAGRSRAEGSAGKKTAKAPASPAATQGAAATEGSKPAGKRRGGASRRRRRK